MRGTIRHATLLVTVVIATGCDQITSKLKGDAGATAAAAVDSGLPAECETFLTRYACFLKKQGKPTTEADDMRTQWTGPASQSVTRPAIQNVCTTQLTVQAQNFKNAGCDGAATAPLATPAADAGKPAPSAAPTPPPPAASASAAPNVDAKGKPCKPWEAAVNGVCRQICYSDNQCKEGLVCNGDIPGRTDKGKYCGDMICKGAEKRLRENHYSVRCMVPCKSDAECKGGKKCGATSYWNEEANGATTRGCE
jgi:hypothetical protein